MGHVTLKTGVATENSALHHRNKLFYNILKYNFLILIIFHTHFAIFDQTNVAFMKRLLWKALNVVCLLLYTA